MHEFHLEEGTLISPTYVSGLVLAMFGVNIN